MGGQIGTFNLVKLAEDEIKNFGEHVRVVFEGQEFTNVEMGRSARRLATALQRLKVKRGDRVLIQMANCPEVFQSFWAIWRIGAIVVPVNHMIGSEESACIYYDCGAETLISTADFLPRIEICRTKTQALRNVILIDRKVPENCLSYWELVGECPEETGIARTDGDEVAAVVYTAGTTGKPKGVMHSHYSLYSIAKMLNDSVSLPEETVSVFVLPLCHIYGLSCSIAGALKGGLKAVVLPSFNVDKIFGCIEAYKANLFVGVPTLYVYMLLHPDPGKYDLSSMRWWISGSAPLSQETWRGFKEKFGFEIIEGWGLTEIGASGCVNPLGGPKKVGSIGRPVKDAHLKIIDSDGKELPQGQPGEIVIRSPGVMKGYWNMPEETAEILRDGWIHTGDIGYVDDDGYYFITDRKKDIIIKGGENISPREIEEVIVTHPKVCEAAVVGIKDHIYGEDIKAFVVLKAGEQTTADELKEYCCGRLKRFKTPKEFVFVDALPKNLVGKVLRKELRRMAQSPADGQ